MDTVLTALLNQLSNHPDLSYAHECGYIAEDPFQLMENNRYPFFNLAPAIERIELVEGMSDEDIERHVYPIEIQFATQSMSINESIMGNESKNITGILKFSKDIWTVIKWDRTLGGAVEGLYPGFSVPMDYITKDKMFIARAQMQIEFYKDIGLRD